VKRPPVVTLVHLGCARNQIDSEVILARLAEEGLAISAGLDGADWAVLNTCSFIGPAREESERSIRALLARKRRGELRGVAVVGCMVQRFRRDLAARFPGVDLFAELSDYREFAGALASAARGARGVPSYLATGASGAAGASGAGGLGSGREGPRLVSTPASYAYLRISHGCDHACSFCAIPAIRGPHRSKSLAACVDEARELIDAGTRELVLVAEDLTAWGRDLGLELPRLVEALAELPGRHRLRLMYAYPNRFPWDLAPLLRDHPRVVPYLDIPVQHAATGVLRAMKRAGSGDQVRALFDRLLSEVPELTLRTTVLLGFPGETAADVEELVEFVRAYRLGRLGAFVYSPEEGTSGWELAGRVPADEAEARRGAVLAARDEVLRASQERLVGRVLEVLIDERHATRSIGRGTMDAPEVDLVASVEGAHHPVGEFVEVEVTGLDAESNLVCRPRAPARVARPRAAAGASAGTVPGWPERPGRLGARR
jgi:ribosomal protein S12 methylthiotransferase